MSSTILALPEKRHFALPAMIVLGALAALALGFAKPPHLASTPLLPSHPVVPSDEIPVSIADSDQDKSDEPSTSLGGPSPVLLPDIPNPISSDQSTITVHIERGQIGGLTNISSMSPWPGDSIGTGNGLGTDICEIGALDQLPRAIVQVAPVYPFEAKSTGVIGQVVVEFVVDEAGRVHNPHVMSASDSIFAEPTLHAVEQWRFTPGTRHGIPVRFRMSVPVSFNLN